MLISYPYEPLLGRGWAEILARKNPKLVQKKG